jgi:uncharacterized membrane protein
VREEELFRKLFSHYFVNVTCIVIAVFSFCRIFYPEAHLSTEDLSRILLMAAAGDLPLVIFYSRRELTRKELFIRKVIHFALVVGINLTLAYLWGWVNMAKGAEVVGLLLWVTIIYVGITLITDYRDRKVTDKLNDKLRERYGPEQ